MTSCNNICKIINHYQLPLPYIHNNSLTQTEEVLAAHTNENWNDGFSKIASKQLPLYIIKRKYNIPQQLLRDQTF